MTHTMKLWERIIEHRLRGVANVTENQFGFMPGRLTSVRTSDGDTNDFPINIGMHQGSALSPYLFALMMDEVTRDIQGGIPWRMLFADDVVLVDESRMGVDQKLGVVKTNFEAKGFRLSRSKTEYMMCDFSATTQEEGMLDSMVRWYPRKTFFAT
jgi:hypothetical protein